MPFLFPSALADFVMINVHSLITSLVRGRMVKKGDLGSF